MSKTGLELSCARTCASRAATNDFPSPAMLLVIPRLRTGGSRKKSERQNFRHSSCMRRIIAFWRPERDRESNLALLYCSRKACSGGGEGLGVLEEGSGFSVVSFIGV